MNRHVLHRVVISDQWLPQTVDIRVEPDASVDAPVDGCQLDGTGDNRVNPVVGIEEGIAVDVIAGLLIAGIRFRIWIHQQLVFTFFGRIHRRDGDKELCPGSDTGALVR